MAPGAHSDDPVGGSDTRYIGSYIPQIWSNEI